MGAPVLSHNYVGHNYLGRCRWAPQFEVPTAVCNRVALVGRWLGAKLHDRGGLSSLDSAARRLGSSAIYVQINKRL